MAETLQSIRGMHDVLPAVSPHWQWLERTLSAVLDAHGYREIRMPVLEPTALFKRSIGEVTDIVEKEMYTFEDRNGDSLTLRPEGTAGCVRAGIEHGLLYNQQQRLWYLGPMFRHERPQKGRYRQFHQLGVELFGPGEILADAELIALSAAFWQRLGLNGLRLELNHLGGADTRARHRQALLEFLRAHAEALDEDSRNRLERSPLRVLDSKNPAVQAVLREAPRLPDFLTDAERADLERLLELLGRLGLEPMLNPNLVRGLDYYTGVVFEWVTDALGAQGTVCAGGRYDGLVAQLGGPPTHAAGFALGMERLLALLESQARLPEAAAPHIYLVLLGEAAEAAGRTLAQRVRQKRPELRMLLNLGGGGMKAQMKRADKSGAALALILGDGELERGVAAIKPLRADATATQADVPLAALEPHLIQRLGLAAHGAPLTNHEPQP